MRTINALPVAMVEGEGAFLRVRPPQRLRSEKVTKQKPEEGDQSFTLLSPPPVAMTVPPGE